MPLPMSSHEFTSGKAMEEDTEEENCRAELAAEEE
jgi:hypothetical protein